MPRQFSWVDQRLVRDSYITRRSTQALALYLLLITVADAQGLSHYSDKTLTQWLSLDRDALHQARQQLLHFVSSPSRNRCIRYWHWMNRPVYKLHRLSHANPPL